MTTRAALFRPFVLVLDPAFTTEVYNRRDADAHGRGREVWLEHVWSDGSFVVIGTVERAADGGGGRGMSFKEWATEELLLSTFPSGQHARGMQRRGEVDFELLFARARSAAADGWVGCTWTVDGAEVPAEEWQFAGARVSVLKPGVGVRVMVVEHPPEVTHRTLVRIGQVADYGVTTDGRGLVRLSGQEGTAASTYRDRDIEQLHEDFAALLTE